MKNMKSRFLFVVVVVASFAGVRSFAEPSLWAPRVGALSQVHNPTVSMVLADSVDPQLYYVLPPTSSTVGNVQIGMISSNVLDCDRLIGMMQNQGNQLRNSLELEADLKITRKEAREARSSLSALRKDGGDPVQISRSQQNYEDLLGEEKRLEAAIKTSQEMYEKLQRDGMSREGLVVDIDLDTQWDRNLELIRASNLGLRFEKMHLFNVKIDADVVGADSRDVGLGALMDYTVNGRRYGAGKSDATSVGSGRAMPSRFAAQMRLNLGGACPLLNPEKFKASVGSTSRPTLVVAAHFDFPSVFTHRLKVTFNQKTVAEKISNEFKGRFFFVNFAVKEVIERVSGNEAIRVEWLDNDLKDGAPLSTEERKKIEDEVKAGVIARALSIIAIPSTVAMNSNLRGSGTCEMSPALCAFNGWQVPNVASLSFEHQRFLSTVDIEVSEEWSQNSIQMVPGTILMSPAPRSERSIQ